jgi:hypothetical protein
MRRRFGDAAHGARRKNFLNPTVEFVIGSGVHAKQGADALFEIRNAGANDRLVVRSEDADRSFGGSRIKGSDFFNGIPALPM